MRIKEESFIINMSHEEKAELKKDIENIISYISDLEEALEVEEDDHFYDNSPKFKELAFILGIEFKKLF